MFRTVISPQISEVKISHSDRIIALGSCFSEMMGQKLLDRKFRIYSNPFGIIYNPVSLHRLIRYGMGAGEIPDETLRRQDTYFHFDAHSRVYAASKEELIRCMRNYAKEMDLARTDWILLTYGTATVYARQGRIVANCHKQPAALFEKRMLSVEEMLQDAVPVLNRLHRLNPGLKIIVTVSPVRHIRDTLELSSVSKSLLRVFTHQLQDQLPFVQYFPSYELLLDDLRDYRFYSRDMIHPSPVAEDYIFEQFARTYFNGTTHHLLQQWDKIRRSLTHRPFHPESKDHKNFLIRTREQLQTLAEQLDVREELEQINEKLRL